MENDDKQVTNDLDEELDLEDVDLEDEEDEENPPDDKDWKAEALKYQAIAKRYKGKLEKAPPVAETKKDNLKEDGGKKPDVGDRIARLEQSEKKREFGFKYNLSPEEVDCIFKINPDPTKEDLENPFISGGLKEIRDRQKQKENTPSSGGNSTEYKGKSFNELDETEKNKNFQSHMNSIMKRKNR